MKPAPAGRRTSYEKSSCALSGKRVEHLQSHMARKKRRCSPAPNAFPNLVRNAQGRIKIESVGLAEIMDVIVEGLPPNSDLDFFVVQIPKRGSAYPGTGAISRLIVMASAMAGSSAASILRPSSCRPQASPLRSRSTTRFRTCPGPKTRPIHTDHLGLWFNSAEDAKKAGGPGTVTPFYGEHNASVQVLNTSNFQDLGGPLVNVK